MRAQSLDRNAYQAHALPQKYRQEYLCDACEPRLHLRAHLDDHHFRELQLRQDRAPNEAEGRANYAKHKE